ncbi:hypothetical protein BD779DRAFT_1587248 [Infundibulicybe gibba]|nr:hypothetical protein BD779DRAFT_1587248 [Infundibulicybe gibba]
MFIMIICLPWLLLHSFTNASSFAPPDASWHKYLRPGTVSALRSLRWGFAYPHLSVVLPFTAAALEQIVPWLGTSW